MAYLNQQQREELVERLSKMKFNRAKHTLVRMDPKGKLAYFRNNQETGKWMTRVDLYSLGTRVTLVESNSVSDKTGRLVRSGYELEEIIVEPMPDNHT